MNWSLNVRFWSLYEINRLLSEILAFWFMFMLLVLLLVVSSCVIALIIHRSLDDSFNFLFDLAVSSEDAFDEHPPGLIVFAEFNQEDFRFDAINNGI